MKLSSSLVAAIAAVSIATVGVADHLRGTAHANPKTEQVLTNGTIADVAERVVASVVNVSSTKKTEAGPAQFDPFFTDPFSPFYGMEPDDGIQSSMGSGVIVTAQGRILTNAHVVQGADDIRVTTSDGTELDAKLVGLDARSDVAVLQLEGDLPALQPIKIGASSKLRLGEVVLAIGNPFAVGQSVTMGIVSAKGRTNGRGGGNYEDFIQTDAAINPGNSGGALVNLDGELVGINTAILSRTGGYQGIGFAIPTEMAAPIMDMLVKDGKVSRGYLGAGITTVNKQVAAENKLTTVHGVLVTEVVDGSPAAKAGLREGDVVVSLDGAELRDSNKLRNTVAMRGAGKIAELAVLRGKEHKTVKVTLGELPEQDQVRQVKQRGGRGSGGRRWIQVYPDDGSDQGQAPRKTAPKGKAKAKSSRGTPAPAPAPAP
jgi:serine protease Do